MSKFLVAVIDNIVNPFILLLFAVAILMFLWGIFQFIYSESQGEDREEGKNNIIYGIVGFVIMIGVYGIIQLIKGTFGI